MLALKNRLNDKYYNWAKSVTFTPGQVTLLSFAMIVTGMVGGIYWLYLVTESFL